MNSVVVTGASSGIGWGTIKVLTERGFHVFGSVRKPEDGERLSIQFGNKFTPLLFDVTDEEAVNQAANRVREQMNGHTLCGLVNNSGIAVLGPLMHLNIADYRTQMEVNLIAPLIVTQAFLPLLGTDCSLEGKPGRIINISSVGGKIAIPFIGAYNASKFGLEGFSESLRRELMLYGIDVIVVAPGAVATAIWDKAQASDISQYENTDYGTAMKSFKSYFIEQGRKGYPPERVGEVIWKALTVANPRARYPVVPNHLSGWIIPRMLPKRMLDKIIAKNLNFLSR
ncbi:SDR family oxidoreductase [Mastigocoleus testarum]|uniref:Oxidoreductase n=1 Tax=Mastigocoleus testarum BC008 TaxID=371196 RepID=A0A0V7ZBI6_9CYAN|nr:SDR family oxidoreductase [Mastigocoleus testarum]KST61872.1 oxidoreductase [Mastigocoleus testarum BC008]